MHFRESWLDDRLSFDSTLWPVDSMGPLRIPGAKIWKADTFFYNAITCTVADELVTLQYTGVVKWSRHMTCTFHTEFNLLTFPFDTQSFTMRRLSFAYPSNELQFVVSNSTSTSSTTSSPSPSTSPSIVKQCFNPDPSSTWENSLWDLQGVSCDESVYEFRMSQSPYTQVTANIHVKRKSASYILKMILPMFVVVCLSTLTYWIDANSPPARVGFTITLVLSIITFNLVVSGDLPKINYSTLLDW